MWVRRGVWRRSGLTSDRRGLLGGKCLERQKILLYRLEWVIFKVCSSHSLSQSVAIWLKHNAAYVACLPFSARGQSGLVVRVSDYNILASNPGSGSLNYYHGFSAHSLNININIHDMYCCLITSSLCIT